MEFRLDTKVFATDGPAGKVTRVIVHPDSRQLSHVVVADDVLGDPRLVPLDHIATAERDAVHLRVDLATMADFDSFFEHEVQEIQRPRPPGQTLQTEGYMAGQLFDLPETEIVEVRHERVPEGGVAVRPGAKVHAVDGHVGDVREFLVDPATGMVSHVVLHEGHLWGQKEVQIPVDAVASLEDHNVYLNLDKGAIAALPTTRGH
jgi:hypothetical protein